MATTKENFYEEVYTKRDVKIEGSSGWIQWKGTSVCMDILCVCGHDDHIDQEFFYYYECPECHRKFAVGQNIKLIELTLEESRIEYGCTPDSWKEQ